MQVNNSNIAFQGNMATTAKNAFKKVANYDTLNHQANNINIPVYSAIILFFVVGTRYFQARDKDEKREILTRDVISLLTYLFATPIFMKGVSTGIEKKTGFLTQFRKNVNDVKKNVPDEPNNMKGIWKKIQGYIRPTAGHQLLTSTDIKNTYVLGDNKLSDFATLITKNTSNDGPQLKKILSFAVKDKNITIPEKNNEGMIEWIKGLENTKNPMLDTIKNAFVENGAVHKKVEMLKAVPELCAIASTIAIAGWILPWFNIQYTRALYKNKAKDQTTQTAQSAQQTQPTSHFDNLKDSQRKVFSEFIK